MKVLIVDGVNKTRGFSDELKNHENVVIADSALDSLDFSECRIIFVHTPPGFAVDLGDHRRNIIYGRFSGGGLLKTIYDEKEADGYRFKADFGQPEQINNVLYVIDKEEDWTREDLLLMMDIDTQLEKLHQPFVVADPFKKDPRLESAIGDLEGRAKEIIASRRSRR